MKLLNKKEQTYCRLSIQYLYDYHNCELDITTLLELIFNKHYPNITAIIEIDDISLKYVLKSREIKNIKLCTGC